MRRIAWLALLAQLTLVHGGCGRLRVAKVDPGYYQIVSEQRIEGIVVEVVGWRDVSSEVGLMDLETARRRGMVEKFWERYVIIGPFREGVPERVRLTPVGGYRKVESISPLEGEGLGMEKWPSLWGGIVKQGNSNNLDDGGGPVKSEVW